MTRCWHTRLRTEAGRLAVVTVFFLTLGNSVPISAQGITTAAIHGTIRAQNGTDVNGAFVRVVNMSTGYASETRARSGNFFVQGLATGGPYRIVVRTVGYSPEKLDGIYLSLGEQREVDFTLVSLATQLDTVKVLANDIAPRLVAAGGVGTSVSDSALRRLPTLNRDLFDFVRLVPQAGTRFGMSGGGVNFRYNSYMIDGVSDRQLQGNQAMGGAIGGKTISLEAVKEYQVLLSPYDARYGHFTGLLINAVTKSGTNDLHGSVYGYMRNEQLARTNSFVGSSPYRREQFGMTLGGPIVKDRLHFFVAPEFQHAVAPAPGPYVGQAATAAPGLPVSVADVTRFAALLRTKGLDPGDGGRVTSLNPALTLFGRLDLGLPEWRSRVVFLENYSTVDVTRFARTNAPTFALSSNAWTLRTSKHATSIQVLTQASTALFNEFMVAHLDRPLITTGHSHSPSIQATVFSATGAGSATLIAGPPAPAGGSGSSSTIGEIGDNVVYQLGSRHTLGAGVHTEIFRYNANGVRASFGLWKFSSLDSLANGDAASYSISKDFGDAEAPVRGSQPSAYITDQWTLSDRLTLTLGVRADALQLSSNPAYNPAVDSVYQRRTSDYPRRQVQWSPRVGFRWEPFADHLTRIRGGAGIFVGPPPLGWLLGPVRSNGAGVRVLACSGAIGAGRVPKFVPEPALQPVLCAGGRGFRNGPVALVDRNLKMAESLRTSLAVDRRLPWGVNASIEALYSKVRSDYLFVNVDLRGPQGTDSHGRVLYGTFDNLGQSNPSLIGGGGFPEVIDLRNTSRGYSWSTTAQVDKPFSDGLELHASYTYSRVRDLQSLINMSAVSPLDIWASGRYVSGRQDDQSTGISSFEIPHRVVLAATYAAPWKRWTTDVSLYYIGESGTPFTFGDTAAARFGDLNADGTSANDPIYVPRDATDPSEITLGGVDPIAQGAALEQFIERTSCLRRQRGTIVARNSCRGPWVNTSNAAIRQSLQAITGRDLSLQLDVFNVLNFLNSSWGLFRDPNTALLQHVGQTRDASPQPVFTFDAANAGTSTKNLESGYQVQLSMRYSF